MTFLSQMPNNFFTHDPNNLVLGSLDDIRWGTNPDGKKAGTLVAGKRHGDQSGAFDDLIGGKIVPLGTGLGQRGDEGLHVHRRFVGRTISIDLS